MSSTHVKQTFMDVYRTITAELLAAMPKGYSSPACAYIRELIDYTVPGGKMNRGLTVAAGFASLAGKELTSDQVFKANVLGWCVEWLQAFFLVADDIMDGSITRRGQPCWYKKPNVGVVAINDSFILESFVYRLITRYFGGPTDDREVYIRLVETFHEVTFQTELGQLLDLTTQPPGAAIDLNDFTMARYKQIVEYKTSYYSFFLPVKLAMILAGVADKDALAKAEQICLEMGEYFQIQDDFLDCYGDAETIGKIGTDIQDGKCSWLVVTALHNSNATKQQLKLIQDNYGQHDNNQDRCVATIKALYKELNMEQKFRDYEDDSAKRITALIDDTTIPGSLNKAIFQDLFAKIYKRSL